MSKRTKIYVFHLKELIYTILFIALAIVLICLLVFMFSPNKEKDAVKTSTYIAGVYTSTIDFQGQALDVQVTVDDNHINDISFVNLDESVATMYPLMETSLQNISTQIQETQSLESVTYDASSQYTSQMLLQAVEHALNKASIPSKTED